MIESDTKFRPILRFAKSKGYLSPLWLTPNSDASQVSRAFERLEDFLHDAYVQGDLEAISLEDIDGFLWQLKKQFAFEGWQGIAPYLLGHRQIRKFDLAELNL